MTFNNGKWQLRMRAVLVQPGQRGGRGAARIPKSGRQRIPPEKFCEGGGWGCSKIWRFRRYVRDCLVDGLVADDDNVNAESSDGPGRSPVPVRGPYVKASVREAAYGMSDAVA
jgi:hypothetical protein